MNSVNYPKISVRSLILRWRQYFSLFLVCAFGVGISLFCNFLVSGMLDALAQKAKIYYGGDFQFIGGGNGSLNVYEGFGDNLEKVREVFPKNSIVAPRIDYDARNSCAFYFEGIGVRQRVIKGIDFDIEQELFKTFNYVEGSAENMANSNGVLISQPIAKMLQCKIGDSITLMLETADDFMNTVDVVVQGIFKDSSLFGMYTSYLDYDFLRKAANFPEGFGNRIGIFFPSKNLGERTLIKYHKLLSEKFNMYKITHDKYDFYDDLYDNKLPFPTFALLPLDSNMQELNIIIEAMRIVTLLIIIALVVIIVVGISSTYRVIVMKRINEIGIYKAIGMDRKSIYLLLMFETIALLIAGCVAGLLIYLGLASVIKLFNFSFIPAFDVFLVSGRAVALFDAPSAVLIFAVVLVTTSLAVLFSVKEAVRKMPCEALAVTE